MYRLVICLMGVLGAAPPSFAAIGNVNVQPTPTQAVISFTVIDPTQCVVQIFKDAAQTQLVDDSNSTLFPGAQSCNRAGTAINGLTVSFVAGLRSSQKASDGKLHSRALAAVTTYYYVITDIADYKSAQGSFTTGNPVLGNIYPEQPPFDANGWDNRAWPQFDWTTAQRNQTVVDPTTGLVVKRMTFAGDAFAASQNSTNGGAQLANAIVNGSCSNTASFNTSGASYGTCTGATTIFMPIPALQMTGGGTFNNWYPRFNIDDLLLYIYGSADSNAIGAGNGSDSFTVCLAQGVGLPCLSKKLTISLKSSAGSTGTVKVPASTPSPVFANWGYTPLHGDVAPTPGTVQVSGNTVKLTNPGQSTTYANAFNTDWPAGSQIYIQGSSAWGCVSDYCTIASIQSAVQLTTVETCNSGCPSSANYEGRAFGFQIARQSTSGSVSVSFGFEADMSSSWSVLEDGITQHCNQNPVTVANDASGNAYPGYTLQGYLCTFTQEWAGSAYWLLISKDQNGAPLGEMRPLGPAGITYTVPWTSNGASFPNGATMSFAGWNPTDGTKFLTTASYNSGATSLLVSGQYNSTKPGCNPPYANWVGTLNYLPAYTFAPDTCFTYNNLTNPSANPPMDLRSQIVSAYATYNPGFDLSGFNVGDAVVTGGYARMCMMATGGGDRQLHVCGTFDATTGKLIQVFDSFSKYPGRWGYVHGPVHALGNYHSLTLDQPESGAASASNVLYGPFQMAVTAVNRAGFGQPPNWTTPGSGQGTAIAANEAYACPNGVPQYLINAGSAGNHCIQVKVSSEPCSQTPGTMAIYPGGKTEAQQFPCTSTDGTVVINPGWSKLQNVAIGDWVRPNQNGNDYDENFIVAEKDVVSPTEIWLWLIRGNGIWPNNTQPPYMSIGDSHPDGISLAMTADWGIAAAFWQMDATDPTATWLPDNPAWVLVHGAMAVGSTPENKIAIADNLQDQSRYAGFFDLPMSQLLMQPLQDLTVSSPVWAGSTAGYSGVLQEYMNNDQVAAAPAERRWVVNYRHLNPSTGNGAEYRSSPGGTDTLTPVPGTAQVYKITDPYSGGPPDPKNLPFILFAGRFQLKDISSPVTTQNTITDATTFSACYAINAGECRTNSNAGDRYVSVPFAAGENQCLTNQYEETAPCFFNALPVAGRIQQMDISGKFDATAARQRFLPTAFTGIGGQYQYSEPKISPDGAWMFLPCWWLNGVRSDICGVSLPPFPNPDSEVRNNYVPYDVDVSGMPGDQVRLCWGYAENGPVDGSPNSLYPTTRQERGCSIGSLAATTSVTNGASFVKTDTSTQGNWEANYGSDGYNVITDSVQYPAYVNVNPSATNTYLWTNQSTDIRALQRVSGSGRVAACDYNSGSFSIDLNFTDGAQHQMALYLLDWDSLGRAETVQVMNGDTGAVLDTRNVSNFSNGIYLVWKLSGHVILNFVQTGAQNAVVNGIFFGGGPFNASAAPVPIVKGPFGWASEAPKYATCSSGCRIRMNLIPDRVAYYVIERNRGGLITDSPVMVAVQH